MFGSGHKASKLKIDLRLSINRLKLIEKKKTEQAQKARKEIADYLSAGKYERARIRVEHIIREDYLVEAMEIVELYCDLLLARFGLIESMKHCDEGLVESVCSIIWVSPRMQSEVGELKGVSDQLVLKYGKSFGEQARSNTTKSVNDRLVHRMSVEAPPRVLVEQYLVEIAKSHHVPYEADSMALMENEFEALGKEEEFVPAAVPRAVPAPAAQPAPAPSHAQATYHVLEHPSQPQPPPGAHPGYPPSASAGMPSAQSHSYMPPQPGHPALGGTRTYMDKSAQDPRGAWVNPGMGQQAEPLPSKADLAAAEQKAAAGNELPFVLPSVPGEVSTEKAGMGNESADLDFDDLTRRFEDLKRKK